MAEKRLNCCENCQIYWTCETKWYRGERNEENACCGTCNYYLECLEKLNKKTAQQNSKH